MASGVKKLAFVLTLFSVLSGCSENDVTDEWCDNMLEKPNAEWTELDFKTFSSDCLLNEKDVK